MSKGKNVRHNRTGTVHATAGDRLLCGSRTKSVNFHDPYIETEEKPTCKNCKIASSMYDFWQDLK